MDPEPNPESTGLQEYLALIEPQRYDPSKGTLTLKVFTAVIPDDKTSANPEGLSAWNPDAGDIFWLVRFVNSGQLNVTMNVGSDAETAGSELEVEIGGQKLSAVTTSTAGTEARVPLTLGSVSIGEPGVVRVMARVKSAIGDFAGSLASLELSGPAAAESSEERVPRDLSSAILQMNEGVQYDTVYNSVTPILSYMGTHFVVCGSENADNLMLADTDCEGVQSISFCFDSDNYAFPWKVNETYDFLLRAIASDDKKSVAYRAYVYDKEASRWQLVGTQNKEVEGGDVKLIGSPSAHIYQSYGCQQGYYPREALFGPMWARLPGGQWEELSEATFVCITCSSINANASVDGCRFRVRTGGDTATTTQPGTALSARKSGQLPDILKDIESKLPN